MDDLIQTPYGEVRAEGLTDLQASFDTRQMLAAVDDLDRFCAQWKRELRADLLRLHGMAHTVINGAPLASVPGEEGLSEVAFSIADEFRDWQESLRSTIVHSERESKVRVNGNVLSSSLLPNAVCTRTNTTTSQDFLCEM